MQYLTDHPRALSAPEVAWQKGFSCFTVSPFDDGALVEYIRNQKEHHANGTIDLDLERFWEPPGQASGTFPAS